MTIRAAAKLNVLNVSGDNTFYSTQFAFSVTDDLVLTGASTFTGTIDINVQYSLKPKKADDFIRQAISNYIFTNYEFTIDPDDIYIPFAR